MDVERRAPKAGTAVAWVVGDAICGRRPDSAKHSLH